MEPEYIERLVRAMIPWPVAWSVLDMNTQKNLKGKKIKIFKSEISNIKSDLEPGTLYVDSGMVLIPTKGNALRVRRFQIEGKKEINEKTLLMEWEGLTPTRPYRSTFV